MPYRQGYGRRRPMRRRRARRRGHAPRRTSHLARKVAMLWRATDTSRKRTDVLIEGATNDTGQLNLLNATVRGTQSDQRVGDVEQAYSIQFRATLKPITANPPVIEASYVRVVIFLWKEPDGVEPLIAQLFQNSTTGVRLIISPYNLGNRGKYEVLYDRTFKMQAFSGPQSAVFKFYKKLAFKVYHTSGNNNGDITSIERNSIYLFTNTDQMTGGLRPVFSFFSRYRYTG